ncbi:hypothetical protein VPH35_038071 [Triticum aestivum]
MASKVELVVEVKSPAEKLWTAMRESTELFPKIFPEQYKSIETVEGDGKSAGTVRLIKYTEGVPMVTFAKEKVEVADDEKKVVSYSVVDGELVSFYKNFRVTVQVTDKGADGGGAVLPRRWPPRPSSVHPSIHVYCHRYLLSAVFPHLAYSHENDRVYHVRVHLPALGRTRE